MSDQGQIWSVNYPTLTMFMDFTQMNRSVPAKNQRINFPPKVPSNVYSQQKKNRILAQESFCFAEDVFFSGKLSSIPSIFVMKWTYRKLWFHWTFITGRHLYETNVFTFVLIKWQAFRQTLGCSIKTLFTFPTMRTCF